MNKFSSGVDLEVGEISIPSNFYVTGHIRVCGENSDITKYNI